MPWWPQNPDEHFLGVKRRVPLQAQPSQPVRQAKPVQRKASRNIIIAPRFNISQSQRVFQKSIFKPFMKNVQEVARIGLEKTESIASQGTKKLEQGEKSLWQRAKSEIRTYRERKAALNAPPSKEEIKELQLRGK